MLSAGVGRAQAQRTVSSARTVDDTHGAISPIVARSRALDQGRSDDERERDDDCDEHRPERQCLREFGRASRDYDKIAETVPGDVLGSAIGPALGSLGRDQVRERIRNSASEMAPSVRGQFFQTLLNAIGGSGGNVIAILNQLGIDPGLVNRPQQASPDDVASVAAQTRHASRRVQSRDVLLQTTSDAR
jgi:hypothetical protein